MTVHQNRYTELEFFYVRIIAFKEPNRQKYSFHCKLHLPFLYYTCPFHPTPFPFLGMANCTALLKCLRYWWCGKKQIHKDSEPENKVSIIFKCMACLSSI